MSDLHVEQGVPLAPRTTFDIGGPARFFTLVSSREQLARALAWAADRSVPAFILGGGSNLLVSDAGIDALVIRVAMRGVEIERDGHGAVLHAGAGEPWDAIARRAVHEDLAGLECLSGIPGDTGATPIQNVGAYGQEVSDTIEAVHVVDRASGAERTMTPSECDFGYRDSIFKRAARGRFVVVRVSFRLRPGGEPAVRYAELERALASEPRTLGSVRDRVIALRRAKSMVIDPGDPSSRSAGSFFTNPVVERTAADGVAERARAAGVLGAGETMPSWPAGSDRVKLAAAWLIERAGFTRGTRRGRAGISERHSLALVNYGGAGALEVVALAREIRDGVEERFGVRLVPEPELVGFAAGEVGDLAT